MALSISLLQSALDIGIKRRDELTAQNQALLESRKKLLLDPETGELARLRLYLHDTSDGFECLPACDGNGHEDECPVTNVVAAFRLLRTQVAELTPRSVVAAVIRTVRGDFIIGQRMPGQWMAGKWCFVGGKVENGESLENAVRREVMEEIGINVTVGPLRHQQIKKYDRHPIAEGAKVRLAINKCTHGVYSISVDNDGGGTRLTPSKCCGIWHLVKDWPLTASDIDEIINTFECEKEAHDPK